MSGQQSTDPEDQGGPGTARRARGLARMSEVYGFELGDLPGDFYGITVDHLFADIWERDGLSVRDRRLILLGSIAAQGVLDIAEIQISAALRNGELDERQLREVAIFLCHYVGWPIGTKFDQLVGKVVHQHEKAAAREE
ncbi:carboxymuconolactone decarboxylase family protein [Tomitella gaofuii]|uniref:carboxymuconolactone decarboxylase family protein n=1 Tax=Tomitella gaofuii TaxID=2760083 RepID=UPI0015FD5D78|nr:carboxymuconolactone decarboxylase family protein [Tomitella gaofuii]